jgi:hypothetical protein
MDLDLAVRGDRGSLITILEKNDGVAGGRRYRQMGRIRPPGGQMTQWLVRQIDDGSPNPRLSEGWLWLESLRRSKHYANFSELLTYPVPYGVLTLVDLVEPDLDEWDVSDLGTEEPIAGIAARRVSATHRLPSDQLGPYVPSQQDMWFSTSPTQGRTPVPILVKQRRAQGEREVRLSDWRQVGTGWIAHERRILEKGLFPVPVEAVAQVTGTDATPLGSNDLDRALLGSHW